jgi:hypothetical protein
MRERETDKQRKESSRWGCSGDGETRPTHVSVEPHDRSAHAYFLHALSAGDWTLPYLLVHIKMYQLSAWRHSTPFSRVPLDAISLQLCSSYTLSIICTSKIN